MKKRESKLNKVLRLGQPFWDRPEMGEAVRKAFGKVMQCGTLALGAEVFASDLEEKLVFHTCKSWACCSCGNRQTIEWQRQQWRSLPDIPFVGLTMTMPKEFWPLFKNNKALQHHLPPLGAAAIEQWALMKYGLRLFILVVQQTFGGALHYHPHLHIMVSAGGFRESDATWIEGVEFDEDSIRELWRFGVIECLSQAYQRKLLDTTTADSNFSNLLREKRLIKWHIYVSREMTKEHFLRYAGRYIRRPPISQKRILSVTRSEVTFLAKRRRGEKSRVFRRSLEEFITLLAQHVPGHYQHSMRYFGLLAPRTQHIWRVRIFMALKQNPRPGGRRLSHEFAMRKYFGVDVYHDSQGNRMRWARSQPADKSE